MSVLSTLPPKRSVPITRRRLVDEIAAVDFLAVLGRQWAVSNTVAIEDVSVASMVVVDWVCEVNPLHRWSQSVAYRVRSLIGSARSCPKCSATDERVAVLRSRFDVERNDNCFDDLLWGSAKMVWWLCPLGHSFHERCYARFGGDALLDMRTLVAR